MNTCMIYMFKNIIYVVDAHTKHYVHLLHVLRPLQNLLACLVKCELHHQKSICLALRTFCVFWKLHHATCIIYGSDDFVVLCLFAQRFHTKRSRMLVGLQKHFPPWNNVVSGNIFVGRKRSAMSSYSLLGNYTRQENDQDSFHERITLNVMKIKITIWKKVRILNHETFYVFDSILFIELQSHGASFVPKTTS